MAERRPHAADGTNASAAWWWVAGGRQPAASSSSPPFSSTHGHCSGGGVCGGESAPDVSLPAPPASRYRSQRVGGEGVREVASPPPTRPHTGPSLRGGDWEVGREEVPPPLQILLPAEPAQRRHLGKKRRARQRHALLGQEGGGPRGSLQKSPTRTQRRQ